MKKVLVIDDKEPLLMVLAETLQMLGFECLTASDGVTGIEMAKSNRPDLILCDLSLPLLDGFQVLAQIRQTESLSNIPFILCSGMNDGATRQKGLKAGADDVLGKPVSVADLMGALNRQLPAAA